MDVAQPLIVWKALYTNRLYFKEGDIMKIKIPHLDCLRCGHGWTPTQEEIRICPKCKSPYWDRKRKDEVC